MDLEAEMDEDEEVIQEFLIEGNEGLDQLDQELLALEDDPSNPGRLAGIFRTVHSLKGTSGFLGFSKLEAISHVGETLLSNMRDGSIKLNQPITDALLKFVDASREILANIASSGSEGDGNYEALVLTLAELAAQEPQLKPASPFENLLPGGLSLNYVLHAATPIIEAEEPKSNSPFLARSPSVARAPSLVPLPSLSPPPEQRSTPISESAPSSALELGRTDEKRNMTPKGEMTIRVDVALLDRLMNLVGELVLSRNQVLQVSSKSDDAAFLATTQRLNRITTELQEGLMKTRMQPIKSVWAKFPRVVRDLAKSCEKDVRLEIGR